MTACNEDKMPASACHSNDLAIIKVFGSFKFRKGIRAIKLPLRNEPIADPDHCTVAGWGVFKEVDDNDENAVRKLKPSNELRSVDVSVPDTADCAKVYNERPEKFVSLLCAIASDGNGTSCAGDSGGPLWCKNENGEPTIRGVVSGSSGYCGVSLIGVYVNAAKYVGWIQEVIARHSRLKNSDVY